VVAAAGTAGAAQNVRRRQSLPPEVCSVRGVNADHRKVCHGDIRQHAARRPIPAGMPAVPEVERPLAARASFTQPQASKPRQARAGGSAAAERRGGPSSQGSESERGGEEESLPSMSPRAVRMEMLLGRISGRHKAGMRAVVQGGRGGQFMLAVKIRCHKVIRVEVPDKDERISI